MIEYEVGENTIYEIGFEFYKDLYVYVFSFKKALWDVNVYKSSDEL